MNKTSVLFVCLGNICRSPVAEAIFRHSIEEMGMKESFIVDSAGTGSWHVGKAADSRMRFAAKQRNFQITSIARQINKNDFKHFNHILAMDNSNLQNILNLKNRESASDYAKIHTIQEFSVKFTEKEVPDPYFGGEDGFQYVIDILEDSVNSFLGTLI